MTLPLKSEAFIDTGGWFALQVPDDRWHATAVKALRGLTERRARLLTTNHVIGETYTLLRVTRGHAAAWHFVDTLARSALLEVAFIDEALERDAWSMLHKYGDHAFSFVDATSFAAMKSRGLSQALAFDKHFAAAGFIRIGVGAAE